MSNARRKSKKVNTRQQAFNRFMLIVAFLVLWIGGIGAGLMSVLVVALYIQDPAIQSLYSRPQVLWLLAPLVLYWISRVWILVDRGDLHEERDFYGVYLACIQCGCVLTSEEEQRLRLKGDPEWQEVGAAEKAA